jgi:Restriction endonuclease
MIKKMNFFSYVSKEARPKMTPLTTLLDGFRSSSLTEREKGTYFEELILSYLRNEAVYRDLYSDIWTYAQWAGLQGLDRRDAGIDLVAKTGCTGEYSASFMRRSTGYRRAISTVSLPRPGKDPSRTGSSSARPTTGASTPKTPCATNGHR